MAKKTTTKFTIRADDKTRATLNSIKKNFNNMGRSAKTAQGGVGGLASTLMNLSGGAMGIAAGFVAIGAGMTKMYAQALTSADAIQKLGLRLNASAEELSTYQYISERAGVSFNTLTMAWQRMIRRVSEAAKGTGEAKAALKEMGLEAKALSRLSPSKEFEAIVDALRKMPEEDQLRLAMKVFDSEGAGAVIQILNQDIDELTQRFTDLGGVMSEDMVRAAADAKDAATDLRTAWGGLGNELMQNVAPVMTAILNGLTDLVDGTSDLESKTADLHQEAKELYDRKFWKDGPLGLSIMDVKKYNDAVDRYVVDGIKNWKQELQDTIKVQQELQNEMAILTAGFNPNAFQFGEDQKNDNTPEAVAAMMSYDDVLTAVEVANNKLVKSKKSIIEKTRLEYQAIKRANGVDLEWIAIKKSKLELLKELSKIDKAGMTFGDLGPPGAPTGLLKAPQPADDMNETLKDNSFALDFDDKILSAVSGFEDLKQAEIDVMLAAKEAREEMGLFAGTAETMAAIMTQSISSAVLEMSDTIGYALGDILANMIGLTDGPIMIGRAFKQMTIGILKDLSAMIVKMLIVKAIMSIFPGFGLAANPIVSIASGVAGARADGGPVGANQTYLVGERGPELFTPNNGGSITPNEQLGGSVTNNNSITIKTDGNIFSDPLALRRVAEVLNDELSNVQNTYYATS